MWWVHEGTKVDENKWARSEWRFPKNNIFEISRRYKFKPIWFLGFLYYSVLFVYHGKQTGQILWRGPKGPHTTHLVDPPIFK